MAVNVSDSIYLFGLSLEGHHLIQLFKFHPEKELPLFNIEYSGTLPRRFSRYPYAILYQNMILTIDENASDSYIFALDLCRI